MQGFIILIISLVGLGYVSNAQVINIPADQPSIQVGIDAAGYGDTVMVAEVLLELGIESMVSILDQPMKLEEAIHKTSLMPENTGERIARLLKTGKGLP